MSTRERDSMRNMMRVTRDFADEARQTIYLIDRGNISPFRPCVSLCGSTLGVVVTTPLEPPSLQLLITRFAPLTNNFSIGTVVMEALDCQALVAIRTLFSFSAGHYEPVRSLINKHTLLLSRFWETVNHPATSAFPREGRFETLNAGGVGFLLCRISGKAIDF